MSGKKPADWDQPSDWAPTVTAILPCYNAEAFVSDTLKSLAAQTWPKLEILIGDDASVDETLAIVKAFAKGRDNARIIEWKQNLGWLANTNDLMAKASGELMFCMGHDDLVAPTYVERLVEALHRNPRAVLAYSDLELFEVDGTRSLVVFDNLSGVQRPLARGYRMASRIPYGIMDSKDSGWWVPGCGLFRTEAFYRIGGFKRHDKGEFIADWPWLLHMAILGEFKRVPEPLFQKIYKKTSLSQNWERGQDAQMALVRSAIREIRQSDLGPFSKVALIAYLKHPRKPAKFLRRLLRPLRNIAKRLLDQLSLI